MKSTPIRSALLAGLATVSLAVLASFSLPGDSGTPGLAHRGSGAGPTAAAASPAPSASPAYGTYAWPVRGPVVRGFQPPSDPYGPGHRGIDIGAPVGTPMVAAQHGVVAFAGSVAGSFFISIDHPDGVRTTYSWISSIEVKEGDSVRKGQLIGATGRGHQDLPMPNLHFGARIGSTYIDPMLLLEGGGVSGLIHLAPLQ